MGTERRRRRRRQTARSARRTSCCATRTRASSPRSTRTRTASRSTVADAISPALLAPKINVPGVHGRRVAGRADRRPVVADLAEPHRRARRARLKLFGTNGTHVDSLVAELDRWYEFLEFYVAQRVPHVPPTRAGARAGDLPAATGISGVQLPPGPLRRHAELRRRSSRCTRRNRRSASCSRTAPAIPTNLGAPFGDYEISFPSWPPPNAVPTAWYFQPDQTARYDAARDRRRRRQGVDVVRLRPDRETRDRFHGEHVRHLGRAPGLRLARAPARQGARVRQPAATDDDGHGRAGQRRPLAALDRAPTPTSR